VRLLLVPIFATSIIFLASLSSGQTDEEMQVCRKTGGKPASILGTFVCMCEKDAKNARSYLPEAEKCVNGTITKTETTKVIVVDKKPKVLSDDLAKVKELSDTWGLNNCKYNSAAGSMAHESQLFKVQG